MGEPCLEKRRRFPLLRRMQQNYDRTLYHSLPHSSSGASQKFLKDLGSSVSFFRLIFLAVAFRELADYPLRHMAAMTWIRIH